MGSPQRRETGSLGAMAQGKTGNSGSLLRNNCHVQGQESPGAGPARCVFPGPGDTSAIVGNVVSGSARRSCAWCTSVIPISARRDAKFYRKLCRQASWRFRVHRADLEATDRPMTFAYADPPYPGKSDYYPEKQEVNHASLVDRLTKNYPDGWALSTSSGALRDVLLLCPAGVRVCAWFKGPRSTRSKRALVSWEPLIVWGGRPLHTDVVCDVVDGLIARGRFRAFPGAMVGMKPPAFAEWMFRQLGASRTDRLDDLFPGSGAIGRA